MARREAGAHPEDLEGAEVDVAEEDEGNAILAINTLPEQLDFQLSAAESNEEP